MSHIKHNPRNAEQTGVSALISCTPVQQFSNRTGLSGTSWEPIKEMHLEEDDGQDSTERWQAGGTPCRGGIEQCRKQEKAATSQWGLPHGMWSREQVAGRPWLDSAFTDSHRVHLLQWCCLIPSSLHFHTKLPPPGCTFRSTPRTLQQCISLCLVPPTPSLGHCSLFWELLICFTSSNEESVHRYPVHPWHLFSKASDEGCFTTPLISLFQCLTALLLISSLILEINIYCKLNWFFSCSTFCRYEEQWNTVLFQNNSL